MVSRILRAKTRRSRQDCLRAERGRCLPQNRQHTTRSSRHLFPYIRLRYWYGKLCDTIPTFSKKKDPKMVGISPSSRSSSVSTTKLAARHAINSTFSRLQNLRKSVRRASRREPSFSREKRRKDCVAVVVNQIKFTMQTEVAIRCTIILMSLPLQNLRS